MRDTYNDTTATTDVIQEGWDVYGDDEEHLGTVQGLGNDYLVIQKGLIFTKDIYVPFSAVTDAADGIVRVNVGKDELESMGWDQAPTGGMDIQGGQDVDSESGYAATGSTTYDAEARDLSGTTERLALHEEELEARTTQRQKGEVEIRKEVVEDVQTIEVPVQREEVHVRRVPADRAAAVDDASFSEQGETLRVPVMEEEVQITKVPRVREEVEVEKVIRQDTERVSDTVRREELEVSGLDSTNDDDFDAADDARPRGAHM